MCRGADQHGRLERLAHLLGLFVIDGEVMARREAAAQLIVADDTSSDDRRGCRRPVSGSLAMNMAEVK
jgi:hypothetical protein